MNNLHKLQVIGNLSDTIFYKSYSNNKINPIVIRNKKMEEYIEIVDEKFLMQEKFL